jgi:hypothetical protein
MRLRSSLTAVLMILSAASAWSQKVDVKYDRNTDFGRYKTYAWRDRKLQTLQSKANEKLIDEALVSAVNAQLQAKGMTEVHSNPDFYLAYDGGSSIKDSKAGPAYAPYYTSGFSPYGLSGGLACGIPGSTPNVWVSMEGALLFEIIDAKTDSVTWSNLLTKRIKNPGKMPKDLDKAAGDIAKKAFQSFPPKAGK